MATVPQTQARTSRITFEEYCARVPDGKKADLIDGEIFVASPDSIAANDLFLWLIGLISSYVQKKMLGRVFGSRVAFRLDNWNSPEPDLAFLRNDQAARIQDNFVEGPPDLAVEIVSPDSIERDYEKKYLQYQRFGVREYWIVDEEIEAVRVFVPGPRRRYRELHPRKGSYHSPALPGFRLDPAWLWHEKRPEPMDILELLLRE